MKHFKADGMWWLPEESQRRVPGTLTFDDNGLELVLHDALREFVSPAPGTAGVATSGWKVEPIIFGTSHDDRDFTVFDAGGDNLTGPFARVQEVHFPEMVLEGCHAVGDDFAEVLCAFNYLDAWSDPPTILVDGPDRRRAHVTLEVQELATATIAGASVRLVCGVEGTSGDARVDLTRWTSFAITLDAPATAKGSIRSYVRPLQDLLTFCTGRPVRLTSLRLRPTDESEPREGPAEAFFAAVQPSERRPPTIGAVDNWTAPTILTMRNCPMPLGELLERWFALWQQRTDVLTLLLSPLYAPFIYSEHGFASAFQCAEALHDLVLPTRDVTKAEHAARLASITQALESAHVAADTVAWATNVLRSRNDKPLSRKIDDLVRTTGAVGDAVLKADERFGATASAARAGVSHGGSDKTLDSTGRYWYGQALRWVTRASLLGELLDDASDAQRRVVEREAFLHTVAKIGAP